MPTLAIWGGGVGTELMPRCYGRTFGLGWYKAKSRNTIPHIDNKKSLFKTSHGSGNKTPKKC